MIPLETQRARELVLQFGWNATAYQIINPGIALWFSASGDAVVGYVRKHGVLVVAGAPVCAEIRLQEPWRNGKICGEEWKSRLLFRCGGPH